MKWAISQVRGLPHYVDGRVALLGDSVCLALQSPCIDFNTYFKAHAMTTHFGAGAGQAIEDAYILGRLFAHPATKSENVTEALRIYDAIRRPIGNDAVERSLRLGFLYEFVEEHLPPGIDAVKIYAGDRDELQKVVDAILDIWSFHSDSMPEQDWLRAQEMLEMSA